jgi:hypothetical protein
MSEKPQVEPTDDRRPYAAPRLSRLGDVVTMTKMPKTIGVTEPPSKACTGAPSTC